MLRAGGCTVRASAIRAAILGVLLPPSSDQPAISLMLTVCGTGVAISSAIWVNVSISCVQVTRMFLPSAAAACIVEASQSVWLRHRLVAGLHSLVAPQPFANAFASMVMVSPQSQTSTSVSFTLIGTLFTSRVWAKLSASTECSVRRRENKPLLMRQVGHAQPAPSKALSDARNGTVTTCQIILIVK